MGWPEAFPIPDQSADTIVSMFINHYLAGHMYPRYILSDDGTEFKNHLMDQVLQQLRINYIFFHTLPPSKQWKTRSFSQVSQTYTQETL